MEQYPVVDGKMIPPITIGDYTIKYNEFWGMYQCSLDGVIYGEFKNYVKLRFGMLYKEMPEDYWPL